VCHERIPYNLCAVMLQISGDMTLLWSFLAVLLGTLVLLVFGAMQWIRSSHQRAHHVQEQARQLVMSRRRRSSKDDPVESFNRKRSRMAYQLDVSDSYRAYIREHFPHIRIMSLGEYLETLEPGAAASMLPQEELQVLIRAALIRVLGSGWAGTLVPAAVGMFPVATPLSVVASYLASIAGAAAQEGRPVVGAAATAMPGHAVSALSGISLVSVLGLVDAAICWNHRKHNTKKNKRTLCMDNLEEKKSSKGSEESVLKSTLQQILTHGETETPTFPSIPNPFILSEHWIQAIEQVEQIIRTLSGSYEPDEKPINQPVAVSEILLPDLHMGAGGIRKTHTNRQIVQNRLFSILMNRLMANYIVDDVEYMWHCTQPVFQVKINRDDNLTITAPSDFIQALVNEGYSVRTRASSRTTTFSFALSVKEEDIDSESGARTARWYQVPLALPLRSGIQTEHGEPVPGYMTHSCIDYSVSGPLMQDVLVESYHNQEGFAGWVSGHYNELPWVYDANSYDLDPARATEVTTLLFAAINSVASTTIPAFLVFSVLK